MSGRVVWRVRVKLNCGDIVFVNSGGKPHDFLTRREALKEAGCCWQEDNEPRVVRITYRPKAKPEPNSLGEVAHAGYWQNQPSMATRWRSLDRSVTATWERAADAVRAELERRAKEGR